jgi:D-alanyl-D-alanine carboxypeptidase
MRNKLIVGAALIVIFIGVLYQNFGEQGEAVVSAEMAQDVQSSAVGSELEQEISAFLTQLYPDDEPGISVILAKGDEILYRNGHGMANLEHNISISPEMVFRLGSLTKQMTTASIMMLAEEGLLQVDDPITQYFPNYPTHGYTITLRHLMTHTSGIIDFLAIEEFPEIEKEDITAMDVIDFFKNQPMNFAPGEAYSYTNSGYVMLGAIIEQLTGQSYEDFVQERIFTPLEMDNTYHGSFKRIIPNRVTGYAMGPNGYENSSYLSMTIPGAAGAIISTVDDLHTWNNALFAGDVVSMESLEEMTTPFTLNNGELSNYGFGLAIQSLRGQPMISHTGWINGFITYSAYLPESDMYVAVLGNTGYQSRVYEANTILAMAIGDPYPTLPSQAVAPDVLNSYTGTYQTVRGIHFDVSVVDEGLGVSINGGPALDLVAVSDNVFYLDKSFTHLSFVESADTDNVDLVLYTNAEESDGQVARLIE